MSVSIVCALAHPSYGFVWRIRVEDDVEGSTYLRSEIRAGHYTAIQRCYPTPAPTTRPWYKDGLGCGWTKRPLVLEEVYDALKAPSAERGGFDPGCGGDPL